MKTFHDSFKQSRSSKCFRLFTGYCTCVSKSH